MDKPKWYSTSKPPLLTAEEARAMEEQREREAYRRRVKDSGVPRAFWGAKVTNDAVIRWARRVRAERHGGNLVLEGFQGTGKTTQACAVLMGLTMDTPSGAHLMTRFATFGDVLREVRATYGTSGSERDVLSAYAGVRVLCIDDIGTEKPTEDMLQQLFALVDKRYRDGKPTVFTTNYTQQGLGERLMAQGGDEETARKIARRIYQGAEVVRL